EGVVTLPGSVLGSPDYIAPERAREGLSTPETDMWSLGATLYAAVEGRPPYRRETMVETLLALATTRPDPPRRAGPLEGVLSGLLRRNPRSRLSGADTEKLLAAVAQGAGTSRLRLLGRQVGWRGPALPAVAGADPEDDAFAPPP